MCLFNCYLDNKGEPLIQVPANWLQNTHLGSGSVQGEVLWIRGWLTCNEQLAVDCNINPRDHKLWHTKWSKRTKEHDTDYSGYICEERTNQDEIKNSRSV